MGIQEPNSLHVKAIGSVVVAKRTFPRVWQVRNSLRHNDWYIDSSVSRLVQAELEENVVQNMFHDIPVANNAGASLKCRSDMTSCRRIGIAVSTRKRKGSAELPIAILRHYGRQAQSWFRLERPAGADIRRSYKNRNLLVSIRLQPLRPPPLHSSPPPSRMHWCSRTNHCR